MSSRSLFELKQIESDLQTNGEKLVAGLGASKVYVKKMLDNLTNSVSSQRREVEQNRNKLAVEANRPDFLESLLKEPSVLTAISEMVGSKVDASFVHGVFHKKSNKLKYADAEPDSSCNSNKMDELLGRTNFDVTSQLSTATLRKKTHSLDYVLKQGASYKLVYKSDDEVCNRFSLADTNTKKFKNKDGLNETLTTLGINLISLYGFPKKDGSGNCTDRSLTDRLCKDSKYFVKDFKYGDITSMAYNNVLLRGVMDALCDLGYTDVLFRYFVILMNMSKERKVNNFFSCMEVNEKKPNDSYVLIVTQKGYLTYPKELELKRVIVYEVLRTATVAISEYLCKQRYIVTPESLQERIVFYGGHDFPCQGDDITNFFNETVSKLDVKAPKSETEMPKAPKSETEIPEPDTPKKGFRNPPERIDYKDYISGVGTKYRRNTAVGVCITTSTGVSYTSDERDVIRRKGSVHLTVSALLLTLAKTMMDYCGASCVRGTRLGTCISSNPSDGRYGESLKYSNELTFVPVSRPRWEAFEKICDNLIDTYDLKGIDILYLA